jgi:hypothetical protein
LDEKESCQIIIGLSCRYLIETIKNRTIIAYGQKLYTSSFFSGSFFAAGRAQPQKHQDKPGQCVAE